MKGAAKTFLIGLAIILAVMSVPVPVAAAAEAEAATQAEAAGRGDLVVEIDVSLGTEVYVTLNGKRYWTYNGTSQCFSDAFPVGLITVQPMVHFGTTAAVSLHRILRECKGTAKVVAGASGTLCTGDFEYFIESNPPRMELIKDFKATYRVEEATCSDRPALKLIIQ